MSHRSIWKLILLLLALTTIGCGTVGHDRAGIKNFDQVSPDLYRGAQPTRQGIATLAQYNVKTVINLRDSDDARESQLVRDAGMTYHRLPLNTDTITAADAERFLALVAASPGPVFVHCLVGRDRTGLAVASYRLRVQGWSEQSAARDLYSHGHLWLLCPRVRTALIQLASTPPATPSIAFTAPPHNPAAPSEAQSR